MNTFDIRVERRGQIQWLKDYFTPDSVKEHNMLGYAGAEFEFPTCPAFVRGVKQAAEKGLFGFTLVGDDYRNAVKWWLKELRDYDRERSFHLLLLFDSLQNPEIILWCFHPIIAATIRRPRG